MRVRRAMAATSALVVAGLALTACQSDASTPAKASGAPTASAPTSAAAPDTVPTASATTKPGKAATAACTTANLIPDVSVGTATPPLPDLASVIVTFGNKGDTCTLTGFAGVDLVTGEGPTSVPRGRKQPATVTLAKAQIASFTIWYRTNPKGHPGTKVTTMTITPPGETHAVKMTWPGTEFATGADATGTDTLFLDPVGRNVHS